MMKKEHSDWNETQRKIKGTRPTFPSTHGLDIVAVLVARFSIFILNLPEQPSPPS